MRPISGCGLYGSYISNLASKTESVHFAIETWLLRDLQSSMSIYLAKNVTKTRANEMSSSCAFLKFILSDNL